MTWEEYAHKYRLQLTDEMLADLGKLWYTVLEGAAQICDEQAQDIVDQWYGNEDYRRGAAACAKAIRTFRDDG